MLWDQATENELKTLWADGRLTTVEIGRRLGCSKGTITGKRDRLGLEPRPSPIAKGGRTALVAMQKPERGDSLPELASVSAPLPASEVVLFQTTGAPILSIEDRDRRILLMADRSHGQCARLLGISPDVVRHVRAKQQWTPPEPRSAALALPPPRTIQATYQIRSPSSCQWPTGERTSVYHTYRYCGCAEVVPGKPYCAEHAKLAYVRVNYYNNERSLG
jgi:GcrA cell cycle regulator